MVAFCKIAIKEEGDRKYKRVKTFIRKSKDYQDLNCESALTIKHNIQLCILGQFVVNKLFLVA